MPWIAPAIGVAGALGSGIIGAGQAGKDRDAATEAYQQSVNELTAIGVPSVEAQKVVMQRYQSAGLWTPELEQSINLQDSRLGSIQTNDATKQAQLNALAQLQEIGSSGGMTLSDRANLEKTEGNLAADLRGQREAILQDAAQRGGYGSGSALTAQLMAQQGSANRAHDTALQTEASARDRALQAIQQAGTLGGQMQQTEFNQKAQQAAAQDAINKWNAENQQGVGHSNTGVQNQAAQYNLGNAQNLMNSNTDIANKEETYNKGLIQQNFQNESDLAKAKANARAGQASNLTSQAKDTASQWGNIGSAVAQGGAAVGQALNSDANDAEKKKKAAL